MPKLRILHCLRAPVGGLFRHVCDLTAEQARRGHLVGALVDSSTTDALTEIRLAGLSRQLALGLHRAAMSRELGWRDLTATAATSRIARELRIDIIHGHGAKGGAYARLAAARLRPRGQRIAAFYTPHGGSLHYASASLKGRLFTALERHLAGKTDGIIFESAYSARVYNSNVAAAGVDSRVIPNGLLPDEFIDHRPAADARDVVFVGELRQLKGVDVLLGSIALLRAERPISAVIVGDGPDAAEFKALAARLGLGDHVVFAGALPARTAFAMGRVLAMPSRAESLPYIVLEAAAAGMPLVATDVGGIPEIVAGTDTTLIPAGDEAALGRALLSALSDLPTAQARATRLKSSVASRFTVERMTSDILDFYVKASRQFPAP